MSRPSTPVPWGHDLGLDALALVPCNFFDREPSPYLLGYHSSRDRLSVDSDDDTSEDTCSSPSSDDEQDSWDDDDERSFTSQLLLLPPPPLEEHTSILVNRRHAAHGFSSARQDTNPGSKSTAVDKHADNDPPDDVPPPGSGSGWFGRDGKIVMSLEGVPGLGFIVAIVHFDRGFRALAECSSSTIILIATALGQACGGPLGAGAGAMCATPLAMAVKNYMAGNIQDPDMRARTAIETSMKAVVKEMVTNGASAVVASWLGARIVEKLGPEVVLLRFCKWLLKMLTGESIKRQVIQRCNTVMDVLICNS
ncbi:hypothetical protein EIP86_002410 [Pleurotus ostreatoroseus]|nr:hypothetical protein EIP86_002410 [Pleurotus ostreatoroseus]